MAPRPKIDTEQALLMVSDSLAQSARNPNIFAYTPHAKQHIFHTSKKKKKLYIGGNRSGKTTGGVTEDIWRATCRHPYRQDLNQIGPNRGRVVAVDFPQGVEKIIFPQFKQWLYPSALKGGAWETAYDKTLRTLTFSNNSFIEFMSYDQDLDKFSGTSRHWIHFDEEPPKPIFGECKARLVDTYGDFYITMTPVEGMTWVYDELYEPNLELDDPEVEIIEVEMYENPHLNPEAIAEFVKGLDEEELTKRVQGKFHQVGGIIYKGFDPNRGGLHVLEDEIPIPELKYKFKKDLIVCSLDHGLRNPTAVLWHAVDSEGYAITFREHYQAEWTVDQHASRIKEINREHGFEPDIYVGDPAIAARNGVTNTSIQQEYLKYGIPFTLGNNDVKAGIIRFKKYMKPTAKGYPRWRITPNCEKTIWELRRYRWKTYSQKKLNYENNLQEEPHKKNDHAADALRYFIMTRNNLAAMDDQENLDDLVSEMVNAGAVTQASKMNLRADPFDQTGPGTTWREYNSFPVGDGDAGWEVDEHLGGYW